jgi:nitroreductase
MTASQAEQDELLRARYGNNGDGGAIVSNGVITALISHRSVRRFTPDPLPPHSLESIVTAAQSAATSSNLQTWSVIALQDPDHKSAAATLCADQQFIRDAPLFLVFCADLHRLERVSESVGLEGAGLDYMEMYTMAVIDAALAGENAAVAAESLGLGICFVGAARDHPRELAALLNLPRRVIALFGMAIGRPDPDQPAAVKPRLPREEVLHRETYSDDGQAEHIATYNQVMTAFYSEQHMNIRGDWSTHSARRVAAPASLRTREHLREILIERGFELK